MIPRYIFEPTAGSFGTSQAPDLLHWVGSRLELGANVLLVDLCNVTQLESSGLGTLMIACNRARRAGGRLALCSLTAQTRRQIERAGLIEKFDVYSDRREFERFVSGDDDLK